MTKWLIKHCIKNSKDTTDLKVRSAYGTLGSVGGIIVNLALSAMKYILGVISGSFAIMADAVNNLSDAAGSIMSLVSIRLAAKPIDKEHPFGHGRMEYIGSLGIGMLIIMAGVELFRNGIDAIRHPSELNATPLVIALLVVSVLAKLWLYFFYGKLGKLTDNEPLIAASKDSISDVLGTSAVLASTSIQAFTGLHVDGWMGLLVSLFVLKTGLGVCKDTIDLLIGARPSKELVDAITNKLLSYKGILGIHDLVIHDYGPGRRIVTVHAEVDARSNILDSHELIDKAERDIEKEMHLMICIHMDPIVTDDPVLNETRKEMEAYLKTVDPNLSLHDFRMVPGKNQINLIFDCLLPDGFKDVPALNEKIQQEAKRIDPRYVTVVRFDTDFIC